jgi:hypothetical protein
MVEPAVVDLAQGSSPLAEGSGIAGSVGSGHVAFDSSGMDGWAVWIEGEAERDDERRRFMARASADELRGWHGDSELWGCPVDTSTIDRDGRVELVTHPTLWLDDVDFVMLPDTEEPAELGPLLDLQPSFLANLRDPRGWSFHYEPL